MTHDQLIAHMLKNMRHHNMTAIKVDHISDIPSPAQIGNFVPDATGLYGTVLHIFEAETKEGLTMSHTQSQLETFLTAARRSNGYFVIVVSAEDKQSAQALLNRIGATTADSLIWAF